MARTDVLRTAPYDAVVQLIHYLLGNWNWIDGDLLRSGLDLRSVPGDRMLNALESWVVQDSIGEQKFMEARKELRANIKNFGRGVESYQTFRDVANDGSAPVPTHNLVPITSGEGHTAAPWLGPPLG